jgi:hypothetical protein
MLLIELELRQRSVAKLREISLSGTSKFTVLKTVLISRSQPAMIVSRVVV